MIHFCDIDETKAFYPAKSRSKGLDPWRSR